VSELESSLDLRLFERGTRALKLTQEGRALYERTGALLAELDETAAAIASGGDKPRGSLRISAPLLFSQIAMAKLASEFALTGISARGGRRDQINRPGDSWPVPIRRRSGVHDRRGAGLAS
jgi:hypothetical protein